MPPQRRADDTPLNNARPKRRKKVSSTSSGPDWRVAIDFGTTNTAIAFSNVKMGNGIIHTLEDFPGDPNPERNGTQVPSEISFQANSSSGSVSLDADRNVLYGYQIRQVLELPDDHPERAGFDEKHLIRKAKLLLDSSEYLATLKSQLVLNVNELKRRGFIERHEEVITDLLKCFLLHTKKTLQKDYGLHERDTVELTFAVPVCWSAKANNLMSSCIEAAMKYVRFGTDGLSMCNLFMVNEAEASAVYAMHSELFSLKRGETFILLGCGGGTTEAGIYTIAHEHPLRLATEVVHPKGAICGSGDLNDRFRDLVLRLLENEGNLLEHAPKSTIANIVDSELMPRFESDVKRQFEINDQHQEYSFRLRGLKPSQDEPRLMRSALVLSYNDMEKIFRPSLMTVERLMKEQLNHSLESGTEIDKVVLVGGFGDSPALREHIENSLAAINRKRDLDIRLVVAPKRNGAVGVAKGALMRAQNKENGPKRIPCQSIGVLHHVRDDRNNLNESPTYPLPVLKQKGWSISDLSGEEYLMNTIEWLIKVGQGEFEAVHTVNWPVMHDFAVDWPTWIVKHKLFVSDVCKDDFYTRSHPKNKGKTTELATIEFDLTYLKQQIVEQTQALGDEKDIYEVDILIKLKLIDRHLEFTAHWPADDEDNAAIIRGSQKLVNVVAAFQAGTK